MMLKHFFWILIGVLTISLAMILFWPASRESTDEVQEPTGQDKKQDEQTELLRPELTQAICESAGGTWNACGSACRTEPGAACIQVCVEYCECVSSDECPQGFVCGDFVTNVGVCVPFD